MDDTERLYLQAANALADQMGYFSEEEVGKRMGLDPAEPDLRDDLIRASQDLLQRGHINSSDKGKGMGRRGLRITTEGKDVAEKQEPQQMLKVIHDLSGGNPAEFVYWDDIATEMGWDPENEEHRRRSLAIAERLSRGSYINIEADEGDIYRITARGMDQVEGRDQYIAAPFIQPEREPPPEIQDSLRRFQVEHTDRSRVAFIMMQFQQTPAHDNITEAIKATLGKHGIVGVRADEKEYHDDLLPNVLTYLHGCGFGIAVFERIKTEEAHNPNVALEVGYLLAMGKPVCLLKDRNLPRLQADLVGRLYRQFDSYDPADTIPPQVSGWLRDRGLSRR